MEEAKPVDFYNQSAEEDPKLNNDLPSENDVDIEEDDESSDNLDRGSDQVLDKEKELVQKFDHYLRGDDGEDETDKNNGEEQESQVEGEADAKVEVQAQEDSREELEPAQEEQE